MSKLTAAIAVAAAMIVVWPVTGTAQLLDAFKRLKDEAREVSDNIGQINDAADKATPEAPASQAPDPGAGTPKTSVAPAKPSSAVASPAPAQPAASTTTGLSGRWKYVYDKNGGSGSGPRSIIGNDLEIQESGGTWKVQLAFGAKVLTALKCSGGGSVCVVEKASQPNLACTSTAPAATLVLSCVWDIHDGQARYTYTFERSGPNLTVRYGPPDGGGTTFLYARN